MSRDGMIVGWAIFRVVLCPLPCALDADVDASDDAYVPAIGSCTTNVGVVADALVDVDLHVRATSDVVEAVTPDF